MVDITLAFMALQTISITVGVIYHIMTLRNTRKNQQLQLETRQAQMFMQIYQNWGPTHRRAIDRLGEMEFDDYIDFKERFGLDFKSDLWEDLRELNMYFEGIGVLVKEGLLNIRYVALLICGVTVAFWQKMGPVIEGIQEEYGWKRMWSESKYLYEELIKYIAEHPELSPF